MEQSGLAMSWKESYPTDDAYFLDPSGFEDFRNLRIQGNATFDHILSGASHINSGFIEVLGVEVELSFHGKFVDAQGSWKVSGDRGEAMC